MSFGVSSMKHKLSKPTSFFGVKLWIAIIICIALVSLLVLLFVSLYFYSCRRRKPSKPHFGASKPVFSRNCYSSTCGTTSMDRRLLSRSGWEIEMSIASPEKEVVYSDQRSALASRASGTKSGHLESFVRNPSVVLRGKQYGMREIEEATNWLADESVIGSGEYGVVYRGVLADGTQVAVKKLISNSGKEEEFMVDVEAIWSLRHKNLVKLLGYCTEGTYSYVAPEYASTGVLDAKSDVYSFGILMMEIISGKTSVEYSGNEIEEYLIEWVKFMVANQNFDHVVDPKLLEIPSLKELKRVLLIALRCVDPDVENRPKMGDVIHMLEPRDLLLSDERVIRRETSIRSSSKGR
ncbi:hypothetical protein RJ639_030128 [Escallonia herrerae]|uniref:non-specific serine/threonine protein kinase n=1 Tax=Escallonia herrerae TaxID=1293975 RepID=A0AA88XEU2_9ASTE|nr:hypothetical protein RJ639_030128 [Escallonia herrerae]